jgi:hypothetical protein
MIQPNELRIGNWVWRNCCYDQVTEIRKAGIVGTDTLRGLISQKELNPIPLTDELIAKQGWEKVGYYYTDKNGLEIYETNDGWLLHIDDDKCQTTIAILINSVHELQNAYFVATKKELEVKL